MSCFLLFEDCFETNLPVKYPLLAAELLNVFGAIVCGSQVKYLNFKLMYRVQILCVLSLDLSF